MKTLKTSKLNVVILWNGLRRMAPREFPNAEEIKTTGIILDLLEPLIPDFVKSIKHTEEEAQRLTSALASSMLTPDQVGKERMKLVEEGGRLEKAAEGETLEIQLEDAHFNILFQQVQRWAKLWFSDIRKLIAFQEEMDKTNQQPKGK